MTDPEEEVCEADITLETLKSADSVVYMPEDPNQWAWRFLVALCDATNRGWIDAVDVLTSGDRQGIEVELSRSGLRATAAYRRRQAMAQEREDPTP